MLDKKPFLTAFIVAGLVMKLVGEVVHEIFGHGLFVLLFGGKITGLYISVLWPYELSYIKWSMPSTVDPIQMAWVSAGGIFVCLCLSFITQVFLLVKRRTRWYLAIALFWLAFWTFMNSTGYLIIGGLTPFGDILRLIQLGVLTSFLSLVIGLSIFLLGLAVLSWILGNILFAVFPPRRVGYGVAVFWLLIPVLVMVMLANPERGLQASYLPLTFIPALLSFALEYFLFSPKQESEANPDNVAEKQGYDEAYRDKDKHG